MRRCTTPTGACFHRLGACPEVSDLDRTLLSLDSTMKRFENALMRTRMLPVSTVFGRFTRLVRDVARSEGKRVRLVATGGETLLDKTVLDRLGEPLVHLLTNAIVHGIEPEADRLAAGKPAEASLVLRAAPMSDRVVITVSDNGRGLDVARIQAKAEALGLAVAGGDTEQVSNLIFRPGFSTTDQVSTLAGRGVGLDVVAQSIRELGGTIEIRNVPGQGVTFVLGLPLTLAIVKSLIIEVDQRALRRPAEPRGGNRPGGPGGDPRHQPAGRHDLARSPGRGDGRRRAARLPIGGRARARVLPGDHVGRTPARDPRGPAHRLPGRGGQGTRSRPRPAGRRVRRGDSG